MFDKVKVYLYFAIGIGLSIIIFSFMASNAELRIKLLNEEVETTRLTGEVSLLQSDLDAVTSSLERQELEKNSLRKELALLSQMYSELSERNKKTDNRLQNQLTQAKTFVRNTKDEAVTHWANMPLPGDLIRLLKQASTCSDSRSDSNELCIAADKLNWELHPASIQRRNEP